MNHLIWSCIYHDVIKKLLVIGLPMALQSVIMRVLCALILTRFIGYSGIYYGEISAWILADLILVATYFITISKSSTQFAAANLAQTQE